MAAYQAQLAAWQAALASGQPARIATTARDLTEAKSKVDTTFRFGVYDFLWRRVGEIGGDLIEASGTDPRNNVPTAKMTLTGDSPLVDHFASCEKTMVGVIVETAGLRFPFYVKTHHEVYEKGAWTHEIELKGIWDVLSYLVIWPSWWLPIQAQPFSHAVYLWALQTVLESMVAECAMRIQSGIWEFVNNAASLNPDVRAWFGTIMSALARDGLSLDTFRRMLHTPIYVARTNPFLDTSPLAARTCGWETCAEVIKDITRAYGVDTRMDLWLPGDPQPDRWSHLDTPTYVFSTKDRSQIEGPTKTVLDSVLRTVIDLGGSMGGIFGGIARDIPGFDGQFDSPGLGVNFVPPWALLIAPDPGQDSSIISARISHHTPDGWQHIIGGRSPKWAGARRLTTGGHRPTGLLLTQRSDERLLRLDYRRVNDSAGFHWGALRPAGRIPQQQFPSVSDGRALRTAQRCRPLPSCHRTVPRHRQRPLQHRNDVRVHQCAVRQ